MRRILNLLFSRRLVLLGAMIAVGVLVAAALTLPSAHRSDASNFVAKVSVGWGHACAVTTTGAAKCWGQNDGGQVGDGTLTNRNLPVDVCAVSAAPPCSPGNGNALTGITAISADDFSSCALTTGGGVRCWGIVYPTTYAVPVSVLSSGVAAVSVGGDDFACALMTGGSVKCWGNNNFGQLGNGKGGPTSDNSSSPVDVCAMAATAPCSPGNSNVLTGVTAISAGGQHVCALMSGGKVECWGEDSVGNLGIGTTPNTGPELCDGVTTYNTCSNTPVEVCAAGATAPCTTGNGNVLTGVTAISAGGQHTCAVLSGGGLECWGRSDSGQLGTGTSTGPLSCAGTYCSTLPVDVCAVGATPTCAPGNSNVLTNVAAVSAGSYDTCVVTTGGAAECWGDNTYGRLGDGTITNRTKPVAVSTLGSGVAAIAAGTDNTCALKTGGAIACWGPAGAGSLGNGSFGPGPDDCAGYACSMTPLDVTGLAKPTPTDTPTITPTYTQTPTPTPTPMCTPSCPHPDFFIQVDGANCDSDPATAAPSTCTVENHGSFKVSVVLKSLNGLSAYDAAQVRLLYIGGVTDVGLTNYVARICTTGTSPQNTTSVPQAHQVAIGCAKSPEVPARSDAGAGVVLFSHWFLCDSDDAIHLFTGAGAGDSSLALKNLNGVEDAYFEAQPPANSDDLNITCHVAVASSTQSIGTAGGTVSAGVSTVNAQVSVPSGALNNVTNVTVEAFNANQVVHPLGGGTYLPLAFRFSPEGQTFNSAVNIYVNYSASDVPFGSDEADLGVWVFNSTTKMFELILRCDNPLTFPCLTRDTQIHQIHIYTTHFSTYTVRDISSTDFDADTCPDAAEIGANQSQGGQRDPTNPWDYFNPTHDGKNRVDDILDVVHQYFIDDGNPNYNIDTDRSFVGPNQWNLGPPNGQQRVDDILNQVKQYYHDCA